VRPVCGRALAALAGTALVLLDPGARATAGELAHGLPVRWNVAPNYERCTDPGDSLQLTDGRRATSDWIWLDRRTVGWELRLGDLVELWIDLGRDCSVDSIAVSTAVYAPSGVLAPSLLVGIGGSRSQLVQAGAFDGSSIAVRDSTRAKRIRLVVPLHGTEGRFVLLAAMLRADFLFTDEIEVYGETAALPHAAAAPGSPLALGDLPAAWAAQRRLWAARAALPEPIHVAPGTPPHTEEVLRLRARAARWRSAGAARLRVQRVDPWAPLTPWTDLHPMHDDTLRLWPGAWDAAAIDVAWCDSIDARVPIRLQPPTQGHPRATLREVVPVEARDGRWAGDALPLAGDSLALRSGGVQQLWIDIDAQDASTGSSIIDVQIGADHVRIPVRVERVPLAAAPLATFDWTYPTFFALPRAAPETAVRDNREHGIDSWCSPSQTVPWPQTAAIDSRGHVQRAPDYTACDRHVRLLDGRSARWLGWYLDFKPGIEDPSRGQFQHPYLSEAWKQAFLEWLDGWRAHLESQGLDRRRIYLQPFDETTDLKAARFYAFLHAARPDLPLVLTLTRKASPSDVRTLGANLGIAIFEREALPQHADWIRAARSRGLEVWVYDVLEPSKAADPTRDYRLLLWETWARGLTGCGFWSYGDTGERSADAWDDFDNVREDFAVVYGPVGAPVPLRGEALAPSKRWQAFRIGVQETRLLAAAVEQRPRLREEILEALASGELLPDTWRRRLIVTP
jgi:hypothetical protein